MKKDIKYSSLFLVILTFVFTNLTIDTMAQRSNDLCSLIGNCKTIKVKPSDADLRVQAWDSAHIVSYNPAIKNNKILLWLTGTNGSTDQIPLGFLKTAFEQGYRIISVSFISQPGVSQLCIGDRLTEDVDCAAEFRRKRTYGDNSFSGIPDQEQDAIIPRLVKLLQYLAKNDLEGEWRQYLDQKGEKPVWNKIAIAGQSQGGGMAEYIAQHEWVYRIISFSGGWDYSDSRHKKIAGWYSQKFITPHENIFATYHQKESAAALLKEICKVMHIPDGHVFALNQPVIRETRINNPFHVEGIKNPVYKPIWLEMLGSGL